MTRLIRASDDLLDRLDLRTFNGLLLTGSWGEPDAEGIYEPTLTVVDDGMTVVGREEIEFLQDVFEALTETEYRAVIKRIRRKRNKQRGAWS